MSKILTPTEFSSWYDDELSGMEVLVGCTIPILSGLISKVKFPFLNGCFSDSKLRDKESIVRSEFRESRSYRLRYNAYISEIIGFFYWDGWEENVVIDPSDVKLSYDRSYGDGFNFEAGKVYLEIGTAARTDSKGEIGIESQIELLFVTDTHVNSYGPQFSFFGASLNPNKYLTKDIYGKPTPRTAIDFYTDANEEENTHVLNHVFELTYDSYVALVKHLNKSTRFSLNYPGGIR